MAHNEVIDEVIDHLYPGIRRYIDNHIEPGSFLRSVLENDLRGACARAADVGMRWALYEVVTYLDIYAPEECWGSAKKVELWLETALQKEDRLRVENAPPAVPLFANSKTGL
jgi:hypothetical protein